MKELPVTTEQLLREISHLRDSLTAEHDVISTRLDGMDKALTLLQAFADKSPTTSAVAQSVLELGKLHDAALSFMKEAASKQEADITKQLDAFKVLSETTTNSINGKIDDIKERVTVIEGRTIVTTEVRKDSRDNMSLIVAVLAVLIAVGLAFLKH